MKKCFLPSVFYARGFPPRPLSVPPILRDHPKLSLKARGLLVFTSTLRGDFTMESIRYSYNGCHDEINEAIEELKKIKILNYIYIKSKCGLGKITVLDYFPDENLSLHQFLRKTIEHKRIKYNRINIFKTFEIWTLGHYPIINKPKECSGIYKFTNLVNGKVYIGQSKQIKRRYLSHRAKLKSHSHPNYLLQSDYIKYGENNFCVEVIKKCSDKKMDYWEDFYISVYRSHEKEHGYNLTVPEIYVGMGKIEKERERLKQQSKIV